MASQIVVPLKGRERIEELMPCLEFLAHPGSVVVFLSPIAACMFPYWGEALTQPVTDQKHATTTAVAAGVARQRELEAASEHIARVRRLLESRGVIVQLECFQGAVEKELARFRETADQTVVLRSKSRGFLARALRWFAFLRTDVGRDIAVSMTVSVPRQLA